MTRPVRARLGAIAAAAGLLLAAPAAAPAQSGSPRPPRPSAPAYILVEPATGDVVQAKRAESRAAATTRASERGKGRVPATAWWPALVRGSRRAAMRSYFGPSVPL